jgi:hypothetical protein
MKRILNVIVALSFLVIGTGGAIFISQAIMGDQTRASDPSLWALRATGDNVQTHVDAEFVYHQQECVAVSVHVHDANGWHPLARFVDCGHGLVPSNPLPSTVDNGGELGAR